MALLGDPQDRTVLDLACGDGVYARQFKRAGSAEVTGVDISPAMVAPAEAQEQAERSHPFWDDFLALAPLTAFRATRA